jgi:hypothetical protein
MKNSDDTIGNRTRDLPACSAVPQPTEPPRAPFHISTSQLNFGTVHVPIIAQMRIRFREAAYITAFICCERQKKLDLIGK